MKFIILLIQPLDLRNYNRFIDTFPKNHSIEIEVWDLSKIFAKEILENFKKEGKKEVPSEKFKRFENFKNLIGYIKNQKPFFYLDYTSLKEIWFLIFLWFLNFKGCKKVSVNRQNLPSAKNNIIENFLFQLKNKNYSYIISRIFFIIIINLKKKITTFLSPKSVLNFTSGKKNFQNKINFIPIDTFDHELYINFKKKNNKPSEDLICFIHQYYENHPDYIVDKKELNISRYKSAVGPNYLENISIFLDQCEKLHNLPVYTALHPRTPNLYENGKYFKRAMDFTKTIDLINKSKFVVVSDSFAINYIIMMKKPFILYHDQFMETTGRTRGYLKEIANFFNVLTINIDNKNYDQYLKNINFKIDLEKYEEFNINYNSYLKCPSKTSWEIVAEKIYEYTKK